MQEKIETRASPQKVWAYWEKAGMIAEGQRGASQKIRYQVLDVVKGKRFSLLWKTRFVKLLFTHTVTAIPRGSQICYEVQIQGFFSWPIRWLLGNKIRHNIARVLKKIVEQIERD